MDLLSTSDHLRCTIQTLFFIFVSLLIFLLFLSNAYAQDYTQMGLPEGAKYRIGKGRLHRGIAFSPDGTRIAVGKLDRCLDVQRTHR